MARFWKFNTLIGTLGLVALGAAFFLANHKYLYDARCGVLAAQVFVDVHHNPSVFFLMVGAAFVAWQVVMTVLGLLAGFFAGVSEERRTPSYRR